MKRIMFIALVTLLTSFCPAMMRGQRERSLTQSFIRRIVQSYPDHIADSSNSRHIFSNNIKSLAIKKIYVGNPENLQFSVLVKSKGICNQYKSGRCWLFSTMNILRAEMMEQYNLPELEFSQNYGYFWDMLEKSNMFFETVIQFRNKPMTDVANLLLFKKPVTDGGQFMNAANIIAKYGLVPREVMPETFHSNNNEELMELLRTKLREYGLKLRDRKLSGNKLNETKMSGLKDVYRLLVLTLGTPPDRFTWRGKEYTPLSFYHTFIHHDLQHDYVMMMNDPTRPYGKVYEIEYRRNCFEGLPWRYINLPMDKIRQISVRSLESNSMVYFSCDVNKFHDSKRGILDLKVFNYGDVLGMSFPMDKRERIETCDSFSDHAMSICGVNLDKDKHPSAWLVENSFGTEVDNKGYIIMTNEWFGEYMFRLAVEKKYIPADILNMLNQKSIHIPFWYPNW